MAKPKNVYVCIECGYETQKWLGRCPACNIFNTFSEESSLKKPATLVKTKPSVYEALNRISDESEEHCPTGISELDRVLSGGIVTGSLTLLGGEPGIGKSTILLQLCKNLGGAGETILYVSGEESVRQIKMRSERLGIATSNLYLMSETDVESIESAVLELKPTLVVIDSIQTMTVRELTQTAGSITQVRESAARMTRLSKENGISIILVGHVTKDGSFAGPRILEHIVDTVLYFEGERSANYRIIRAVKNRFGSTNEIGIFEMTGSGLVGIENPSEYMLSGRPLNVSGSIVSCSLEGTRPMLAEIQALVCQSSFGTPRRTASGADFNRMAMLLAILEKRVGLQLGGCDAYVNIAGGIKITEPSIDAAICAAVASSYRNKIINPQAIVFGEVGLAGEIRAVSSVDKRLYEAHKLGFKLCVLPKSTLKGLRTPEGIEVYGAGNIHELLDIVCS